MMMRRPCKESSESALLPLQTFLHGSHLRPLVVIIKFITTFTAIIIIIIVIIIIMAIIMIKINMILLHGSNLRDLIIMIVKRVETIVVIVIIVTIISVLIMTMTTRPDYKEERGRCRNPPSHGRAPTGFHRVLPPNPI